MVELVFAPGTPNEKTVTEDVTIRHNSVRTHTGVSDLRLAVAGDVLEYAEYGQRQDRLTLSDENEVLFTGYCIDVEENVRTGEVNISADGIGKRLEETKPDYESLGGSITYSNIAVEDALRDYWDRTPFDNYSVTDQTTEIVAEDALVQEVEGIDKAEWEQFFTFDDLQPVFVDPATGSLGLAQICWTQEAEVFDSGNITAYVGDPDYSGAVSSLEPNNGEAVHLSAGDSVSYNFSNNHIIPENSVEVQVRWNVPTTDSNIDVSIDGNTVENFENYETAGNVVWAGGGVTNVWNSGDLVIGDHTLTVSVSSGDAELDVVAPYDARYEPVLNFDDNAKLQSDGVGRYLNGPELFPVMEQLEADGQTVSYNITSMEVDGNWNGVTNNEICLSNDNGQNYLCATDTADTTQNFTDPGRIARFRFQLARFGDRETATPGEGFSATTITGYDLYVDGNDLSVIGDLELSRNHFQNLKTLHDYGNFLWVIEHSTDSIADMTVSSFHEGDETRPAPDGFDDPVNKSPEIASGNYFNSIYLEGALDDNGNRPTAELKDQDAINEDGREISPGVLRDPKITTEAGAVFRARSLLESAQDNQNFVGNITVPPTMVHPGYSRPVDLNNDGTEDMKTVQEVSLTESANNVEASFVFTLPQDLSEEISSLKSGQGAISDQV